MLDVPAKPKRGLILGLWLRSPFEIGAVAASSGPLARAMARQVNPSRPGLVVELGGGIAAITEALLAVRMHRRSRPSTHPERVP